MSNKTTQHQSLQQDSIAEQTSHKATSLAPTPLSTCFSIDAPHIILLLHTVLSSNAY